MQITIRAGQLLCVQRLPCPRCRLTNLTHVSTAHHPQELPGFEYEPPESEAKFVTTGFARNAVLGVAGEVVKAVQQGHLKHIFLIGGCDGAGERAGAQGQEGSRARTATRC